MLRDPEFGPVRLRAFGTYTIQIGDPPALIREIAGTDGHFTTDEITNQLRNLIVSRFATIVGGSKIPILDLAASYDQMGEFVRERIKPEFEAYGLDIPKLLIENISLPPAVEEALDKRTSMGVIGDLNRYTQYQTAEAMGKAAENPGGMAAGGMGMGMGFAMANQMAGAFGQQAGQQGGYQAGQASAAPAAGGPPPIPPSVTYYLAINGQQSGPFDMNGLRGEMAAGRLTPDTLVWTQGMANWTPAKQVSGLAGLFPPAPPPLPPGA
jgi:membrane protease subunit (stomatin/prohibitin family)